MSRRVWQELGQGADQDTRTRHVAGCPVKMIFPPFPEPIHCKQDFIPAMTDLPHKGVGKDDELLRMTTLSGRPLARGAGAPKPGF